MSEAAVECVGLDGLLFQPLRVIDTPAGAVMHGLRGDSPLMPDFCRGFGEIYFSEILPGCVKAWKKHLRQTQLFMAPSGLVRLVFYDDRVGSSTCGKLLEWNLGRPLDYGLLKIPPGIWHGFVAMNGLPAVICNCADMPHDPAESLALPFDAGPVRYCWKMD